MTAENSSPPQQGRLSQLWAIARINRAFMAGFVLLMTLCLVALFASLLAPYDPFEQDLGRRLLPPGVAHWFGTDNLGRDIFSRVLHGADISLMMGVIVVALSVLIGVPVGVIAGYFGGWTDAVLMRITEVFLAFPPLVLPIAITAVLGPELVNAMIALAISWFPWYARIARAAVLSVKNELYVAAGFVSGASPTRMMFKHLLPNCSTPVIIQGSMDFGIAILAASALSFIGMGVRPPDIEWGLMVAESREIVLEYWWTATFPGLAIFLSVLSSNLIGDGIRDILDPSYSSSRL